MGVHFVTKASIGRGWKEGQNKECGASTPDVSLGLRMTGSYTKARTEFLFRPVCPAGVALAGGAEDDGGGGGLVVEMWGVFFVE
jgi:hypothetical protein